MSDTTIELIQQVQKSTLGESNREGAAELIDTVSDEVASEQLGGENKNEGCSAKFFEDDILKSSPEDSHKGRLSRTKEKASKIQQRRTHFHRNADGQAWALRLGGSTVLFTALGWIVLLCSVMICRTSAADIISLRCNTSALDVVGTTKSCTCSVSSRDVSDIWYRLNGTKISPVYPPNSTVSFIPARNSHTLSVGALILRVSRDLDGLELHCVAFYGDRLSAPSNSVTMAIARLPNITSVVTEISGDVLHLEVTVDDPVPFTNYYATITPGNMSINITYFSSDYPVDVDVSRCALYQIVVHARNVLGEISSQQVQIFPSNLSGGVAVRVIATSQHDMKKVQIVTNKTICEPLTNLYVDGVHWSYRLLHDYSIMEFLYEANRRDISVAVNENMLGHFSTYDIQKTVVYPERNRLHLKSEFASQSGLIGVIYAIVPVTSNSSAFSEAIFLPVVKSSVESGCGIVLDDVPQGRYKVYTFARSARGIEKSPSYRSRLVEVQGDSGVVPHEASHRCTWSRAGPVKMTVSCPCPTGGLVEVLIFRENGSEVIADSKHEDCGEPFDVELKYSDGQNILVLANDDIILQVYLTPPGSEDAAPASSRHTTVIAVSVSSLVLVGVVVLASVLFILVIRCRTRFRRGCQCNVLCTSPPNRDDSFGLSSKC